MDITLNRTHACFLNGFSLYGSKYLQHLNNNKGLETFRCLQQYSIKTTDNIYVVSIHFQRLSSPLMNGWSAQCALN